MLFLSDNGGVYIAAETQALVRALGLKPINTPVCTTQSNGMAESFLNTCKRDYVARMDRRDVKTVLEQLRRPSSTSTRCTRPHSLAQRQLLGAGPWPLNTGRFCACCSR